MQQSKTQDYLVRHEETLHDLLSSLDIPAARLKEAMNYSLFPGGKRLRPLLVYLSGEIVGVNLSCLDLIAAAIELTHCYSLIHDDLPAMDNDDFRRGKPSCHRAFDEATAILVGDGLQILALEILLNHLPKFLQPSQVIAIAYTLSKASGISGMVSGQSLDLLELANTSLTEDMLCKIHQLKTGKLLQACVEMVLAAGNPEPDTTKGLREFAYHLGLAFQMQDDYLDKYNHQDGLGKGRASDSANQKTTFASLYDQTSLAKLIDRRYQQVQDALLLMNKPVEELRDFIFTLQKRSSA